MDIKKSMELVLGWLENEPFSVSPSSAFRLAELISNATKKRPKVHVPHIHTTEFNEYDSGEVLYGKLCYRADTGTESANLCLQYLDNGDKYICSIKEFRAMTNWGLKQAKDACDKMKAYLQAKKENTP